MPRRSSTLLSAKILPTSTASGLRSANTLVGAVQAIEHLLLRLRQVANLAMQQERRFIEQALGRIHILQHHASRECAKLWVFFRPQFAATEHDLGVDL